MADSFEILENDLGQLVLKRPGEDDLVDIRPRQAFPWTRDGEMVSIRTSAGKEVVLVERLSDLPSDAAARVRRWMAANSFIPTICTISSVNTDFGYQLWKVSTDRGDVEFKVQEKEDIRFLNDGRFSIKDVDGNVYVMPPVEQLDSASQDAVRILL